VIADSYPAEYLCSRTYIDVPSKVGHPWPGARTNCDLLEQKAVRANYGIGMYDDSIWMGDHQAASDLAGQGDVRATHDRPKPVLENGKATLESTQAKRLLPRTLI
jgi:hypothetical protein